jgi:hypothetical protein
MLIDLIVFGANMVASYGIEKIGRFVDSEEEKLSRQNLHAAQRRGGNLEILSGLLENILCTSCNFLKIICSQL